MLNEPFVLFCLILSVTRRSLFSPPWGEPTARRLSQRPPFVAAVRRPGNSGWSAHTSPLNSHRGTLGCRWWSGSGRGRRRHRRDPPVCGHRRLEVPGRFPDHPRGGPHHGDRPGCRSGHVGRRQRPAGPQRGGSGHRQALHLHASGAPTRVCDARPRHTARSWSVSSTTPTAPTRTPKAKCLR